MKKPSKGLVDSQLFTDENGTVWQYSLKQKHWFRKDDVSHLLEIPEFLRRST